MKYKMTVSTDIEVEFDENSESFKTLYEKIKKVAVAGYCDESELSRYIATSIVYNGYSYNIPYIGLVNVNGKPQAYGQNHPINVNGDIYDGDSCIFNVTNIEEIKNEPNTKS